LRALCPSQTVTVKELIVDNLNQLTADQLLILHNSLCAKADHIDWPWKKLKRELIELVRTLNEPEGKIHKDDAAIFDNPENMATISSFISTLLVTDMSYREIVGAVTRRFSRAKTSTRSVASFASAMRRQGVKIPWRCNARTSPAKHGRD